MQVQLPCSIITDFVLLWAAFFMSGEPHNNGLLLEKYQKVAFSLD